MRENYNEEQEEYDDEYYDEEEDEEEDEPTEIRGKSEDRKSQKSFNNVEKQKIEVTKE